MEHLTELTIEKDVLLSDVPVKVEETEEAEAGEDVAAPPVQEIPATPDILFILSVCAKKQCLIKQLFADYVKINAVAKKQIQKELKLHIPDMIASPEHLLEMISGFPQDADDLIFAAIEALLETPLRQQIIDATRDAYLNRALDARFLFVILETLDKADLSSRLTSLVESINDENTPLMTALFAKIVTLGLMSAPELVVKLHFVPLPIDHVKLGVGVCYGTPSVFKQSVFAVVLQQLVDSVKLSPLLMYTLIKAITLFPDLRSFVVGLLTRLISKKIWKYPALWEGYMRCCHVNYFHVDYVSCFDQCDIGAAECARTEYSWKARERN